MKAMKPQNYDGGWIVCYAVVLHTIWALMLLFSNSPLGATALHGFRDSPRWLVAFALLVICALAAAALRRTRLDWCTLLLVLPQQTLLMYTACEALQAVWMSAYGDGVVRPRLFIAADQMPGILATVMHTAVLARWHMAIYAHALGNRVVSRLRIRRRDV